jgi:hypothetical protein
MSIYPQPNSWLCGPFALKHALLALGVFENEWAIARAAGTGTGGTDERDLSRAARQQDCSVRMVRVHDAEEAREELVHHLGAGMPTLLCVEQWDHWITAMHHEDGRFVLFDSRTPLVIRVLTWEELRPTWEYREASGGLIYDLHPVVSRNGHGIGTATFSLKRARWLARPRHAGLARQWSDYARLLSPFGRTSPTGGNHDLFARPLSDALAGMETRLMAMVDARMGPGDATGAGQVLERLRFVADTYDLKVDAERESGLELAVTGFVVNRLRITRPVD